MGRVCVSGGCGAGLQDNICDFPIALLDKGCTLKGTNVLEKE